MMDKRLPEKVIYRDVFIERKQSKELIEKRQVEFVISSESVDRHKTVFKQDGGDLNRFAAGGGIVTYNHRLHSGDPDDEIGIGFAYRDGNETIGIVNFETAEINEKADKIFRKIQQGTPYMASIGSRPTRMSLGNKANGEDETILYFREWDLIEFSVVPVGSNPDTHKRNLQAVEEIRSLVIADFPVVADVVDRNGKSVQEAQIIINKNRI